MKRYIKSAVILLGTLGDWLEENKGKIDSDTVLKIYTYREERVPHYKDLFDGTFRELYLGYGARNNEFIPDEDYNYEDYFDQFWYFNIISVSSSEDGSFLLEVKYNR